MAETSFFRYTEKWITPLPLLDKGWKGGDIVNSKQFLQIGGIILILVGILGFVGVIGPTEEKSIFGSAWWFDNGENWAHLLIGIVAVLAAYVLPGTAQKPLVMIVGIIGVLIGLYSLFGPVTEGNTFLGANLQNPADTILHIVIGVWALWASMSKKGAGTMTPPAPAAPVKM